MYSGRKYVHGWCVGRPCPTPVCSRSWWFPRRWCPPSCGWHHSLGPDDLVGDGIYPLDGRLLSCPPGPGGPAEEGIHDGDDLPQVL